MDDTYQKNSRSKYKNKIIKKHFMNCQKSNRGSIDKHRKKVTTNSIKRTSQRHWDYPHRKRHEPQKELSNYRNNKDMFIDEDTFIPEYNSNILETTEDNNNDFAYNLDNMDDWQCDVCTFLNMGSSLYCERCDNCNPLSSSMNEYINIDDNDNKNNIEYEYEYEYEYDEARNIYNYDEDDYNDNIQNVLLQSIDTDNKNKNNNDNIEFDLHVDVAVEENNKNVIAFMDASKT